MRINKHPRYVGIPRARYYQRRLSNLVPHIHVSSTCDESLHHIDAPKVNSSQQWCVAVSVPNLLFVSTNTPKHASSDLDIGTVVYQLVDHVDRPYLDCAEQCRVAVLIGGLDVGAARQQQVDKLSVLPLHGDVNGRLAGLAPGRGVDDGGKLALRRFDE